MTTATKSFTVEDVVAAMVRVRAAKAEGKQPAPEDIDILDNTYVRVEDLRALFPDVVQRMEAAGVEKVTLPLDTDGSKPRQ